MPRKGKIGRLPRSIRDQLNSRIDDGAPGADIVEWLTSLDEVKEVLSRDFEGHPITEQNLSEWKKGGFLDWQRQQEARERLNRFIDLSDGLNDAAAQQDIPGRLAGVLAAELAAETQRLLEETTDPKERFRHIGESLRQLNALRRASQSAERWRIQCEQRERQEKAAAMEEAREVLTESLQAALKRPLLVATHGGGETGEMAADFIRKVEKTFRAPKSPWSFVKDPFSTPSDFTQFETWLACPGVVPQSRESNLIQANPS